ncbi:hypothetical protein EVAR_13811_1 [Eumeta japonica]|uniref:Uncharacterized protein n=1 Tax=Eumeta variegata TaxID=151549 RepID=A0A4C1U1W4_EUMVA|nr:hypothetical protein EVAR_13811_1 [Eumeta japonica]
MNYMGQPPTSKGRTTSAGQAASTSTALCGKKLMKADKNEAWRTCTSPGSCHVTHRVKFSSPSVNPTYPLDVFAEQRNGTLYEARPRPSERSRCSTLGIARYYCLYLVY